jgi:hypothetical protein
MLRTTLQALLWTTLTTATFGDAWAVALPDTVNTPAIQMTGIGDTIGAPKKLPDTVTAPAIFFTGIGNDVGASKKLPDIVNTAPMTMTGNAPHVRKTP